MGNFSNFLVEGDKTVIPLKYFLINFIDYCKEKNINIPDVDFFFNPRDFPILRYDNLEPYDKIFPDKKLKKEYIHDNYTPILSQSGNINSQIILNNGISTYNFNVLIESSYSTL